MDFGTNKTPIEVIKKGAFEKTYFREFILVLMESGTESHSKPFFSVKISSYLCSYFWGVSSEINFLKEQF